MPVPLVYAMFFNQEAWDKFKLTEEEKKLMDEDKDDNKNEDGEGDDSEKDSGKKKDKKKKKKHLRKKLKNR